MAHRQDEPDVIVCQQEPIGDRDVLTRKLAPRREPVFRLEGNDRMVHFLAPYRSDMLPLALFERALTATCPGGHVELVDVYLASATGATLTAPLTRSVPLNFLQCDKPAEMLAGLMCGKAARTAEA